MPRRFIKSYGVYCNLSLELVNVVDTTITMLLAFTRRTLNTRGFARATSRTYASVSSSSPNPNTVGPFQVFDRNAKRIQKDASVTKDDGKTSRVVDYVREEVADRMMERLLVSHKY